MDDEKGVNFYLASHFVSYPILSFIFIFYLYPLFYSISYLLFDSILFFISHNLLSLHSLYLSLPSTTPITKVGYDWSVKAPLNSLLL